MRLGVINMCSTGLCWRWDRLKDWSARLLRLSAACVNLHYPLITARTVPFWMIVHGKVSLFWSAWPAGRGKNLNGAFSAASRVIYLPEFACWNSFECDLFTGVSVTKFDRVPKGQTKNSGCLFCCCCCCCCCFVFFGGGEALIQLTLNSVLLLLYMQGTRSCTECHSWLACISRDLLIRRVSSVLSTPPPPLSFCLPTDYRRTWERGLTIASIEHSVNDLDPLSV